MYAFNAVSSPSPELEEPVALFFSVFPDPATAARVSRLAQDLRRTHRLRGRPHLTARFHCSLYSFDSASAAVVAKATEAARMVTVSPFRVSFNCAKSFSGAKDRHPLVLVGDDGVVGLTRLCASLGTEIRKVPFRPHGHPVLTPHLTLLYDCCRIEEQPIEPVCWTVREFVLVLSLTGRTKHIPLGRWQLHG
jgi:2'-5' RNA ligase